MSVVAGATAAAWSVDAIKAAVEHHEVAAGALKKLWRWTRGRRVAVTGSAGAGKTVLLRYLAEEIGIGYQRPPTSQDLEHAEAKTPQGWRLKMTTIPGQEGKPQNKGIDRLFDSRFFRGPADGVIHVVANGFLSLRSNEAESEIVTASGPGGDEIDAVRKARLQTELDDLHLFCEHIRTSHRRNKKKPSWVIIAVNKADLYLDEIEDVRANYMSGEFGAKLNDLRAALGKDHFNWLATPFCARFEHFKWGKSTVQSEMDDDARDLYARRLLQLVGDYCGI